MSIDYFPDPPQSEFDALRIDTYEDIYEFESSFRYLDEAYEVEDDFSNNKYYIGLSFYDKNFDSLLLASTVQNKTFFKYNFVDIVDYLNNYSILYQDRIVSPEIMKLHIDNTLIYNVVIKTFWIKLIQRNWKRIYKKRKNILQIGMTKYLKNRELGYEQFKIPSLQGMLYHLKEV